jgi:hypothetical protein
MDTLYWPWIIAKGIWLASAPFALVLFVAWLFKPVKI